MIIEKLVAELGWDLTGEEDLRRFKSGIKDAEKSLASFAAAVGTFAAAAGAAVATGLGFLGKNVINVSAEFEKLEATLTTIEGSSDKAKKSLNWVEKFAATTPYDLQQVSEAFVRLRAYGLDPMDGTLTAVGDAASGMGKTLMEGVEAIADATTGENERLKAFGITASVAGDQVTYSWRQNGKEMSKTLKKTGIEVANFLKDNFGSRFNGAMVRQSKTWNGMVSNLGDAWTNFLKRIGEAGVFDTVKNKLADVLDAINRWADSGALDKFAKTLSGALTWGANAFGKAVEQIVRHTTFLFDNFDRFEPYLKAIGAAFAALMVWAFPVAPALVGIGIAIDDFLTYLEGGDTIIGGFAKALAELTGIDEGAIAGILTALAVGGIGLVAAIGPIRTITGAITGLARALGLMGGANVAKGIANVGAAGAASAAGPSLLGRIAGALGIGMAAFEGAKTITNPSDALKNAPRSKTGVDDALRWLYEKATQSSSNPYASDAAAASRDAANANVFQGFEDMLNNGRGNAARMNAGNAAAAVNNTLNDSSNRSVNVNVGGVTVQGVQNASGAVGGAVGRAVGQGAASGAQSNLPPTRIVGNTGAF